MKNLYILFLFLLIQACSGAKIPPGKLDIDCRPQDFWVTQAIKSEHFWISGI